MEFFQNNQTLIFIGIVLYILYRQHMTNKKKEVKEEPEAGAIKSKAKSFLAIWPDLWLIPLVTAIVLSLIWGLSILFPNAHFRGVEAIQGVLIGLNSAFIVFTVGFLFIKLNFPRTWNWYKSNEVDESFNNLTHWQKYLILLWSLSIVCFTVVMAMVAQN